jgi:hypothetical protein
MKLDRTYQNKLLEMFAEAYPKSFDHRLLRRDLDEEADAKYVANAVYLKQHGLIDCEIIIHQSGDYDLGIPRITLKGVDYLAEDGGLSAILNVVTIKLHDQTIRDLLEAKITESTLDSADKPKWIAALKSLSGEAIKHLTMKLLDEGLNHAPNALHAIQTALGV